MFGKRQPMWRLHEQHQTLGFPQRHAQGQDGQRLRRVRPLNTFAKYRERAYCSRNVVQLSDSVLFNTATSCGPDGSSDHLGVSKLWNYSKGLETD
jgi:hypothetical protein